MGVVGVVGVFPLPLALLIMTPLMIRRYGSRGNNSHHSHHSHGEPVTQLKTSLPDLFHSVYISGAVPHISKSVQNGSLPVFVGKLYFQRRVLLRNGT